MNQIPHSEIGSHQVLPPSLLVPGGHAGHVVQFYEDDQFLAATVADFLWAGVEAGQPLLMIATLPHRHMILGRLALKGLDVEDAQRTGRLVCLDAQETLIHFMHGAMPDAGAFHRHVGGAVQRVHGATGLRAYGEMVDVLWKAGNAAGAIRLEELWNDLAQRHSFSLLCAYSMGNFYREAHSRDFQEICRQHRHVAPTERFVGGVDDRQRQIAELQQKARALEGEVAHCRELEQALREALAQRRKAEEELSDFIENASEGLHRVGPDGIILWANRAELDLLGYAAREYVGHHIAEFHVDRVVINDILARLARRETLHNYEARLRCKDGSIKDVLINTNARLNEDDTFAYSRCYTRDVTGRKRLEVEREQVLALEQDARAQAEQANQIKDDFLAMLSHELRTPLNAMLGWIQIANRQPESSSSPQTRRAFAVIERNARLQATLIDDLLDMSRVLNGKLHFERVPVDLASVVTAALDGVRPAAAEKSLQLETRLAPSGLFVSGDAGRLQQVVGNVLTNAIKFTPEGGRVEVELRQADREAQIIVRDTGCGISPEFLPHVFEQFRQAETGEARGYGGLGLGLALVRYIVEAHGGRASADSPGQDRGATFAIHLPLR